MSEYKEIQAHIERIAVAYKELRGSNQGGLTIGIAEEAGERRYYAQVGDIDIQYRPTLGGALSAIEQVLAFQIEEKIEDMERLKACHATLRSSL